MNFCVKQVKSWFKYFVGDTNLKLDMQFSLPFTTNIPSNPTELHLIHLQFLARSTPEALIPTAAVLLDNCSHFNLTKR